MITHPAAAELRAFHEHELAPRRRAAVGAHLSRCTECRRALVWMEDAREALLNSAVEEPPSHTWDAIATRVRAHDVVLLPVDELPRRRSVIPRAGRIAAGAMLFAGAVAALPGSPVRQWLRPDGGSSPHADAVPATDARAVVEPARTILLVGSRNGAVEVHIERPAAGLELRLRLVDGAELQVNAAGEAASAQFRSAPGRISVEDPGTGTITLSMPRGVEQVRVYVSGRIYVSQQFQHLEIFAPTADTIGGELIIPMTGNHQ